MSTAGTAPSTAPLPWWRVDQHPRAWVPLGAVVLFFVVTGGGTSANTCSATAPCAPDWTGSIWLGLLLASAATIFVHRWTAATLAVALTVLWLLAEESDPAYHWWVQVCVLAYAALCVRVATLPTAAPAPPALTLPVPAPTGARPRLGRGWRLLALALLLGGGGITWGTVAQQQRVAAQEDAAQVEHGRVTGRVDPSTITVRLDDTDARVGVYDADAYPIGSALDFYVDGRGLRQPVSEPYDSTGLLALAGLAFGLALAALLRARAYETGLRAFLRRPQPARLVRVINADGVIAVFPFEPTSDIDPPYLIYPAVASRNARQRAPISAEYDGDTADEESERGPVLATLYGVDQPGHWVAAEVDGVLLTPARPGRAGSGPATEPESLDTPVDPAELLPGDRAVDFQVRTHHRNTLLGVIQTLAFGAGIIFVFARFLILGTVGLAVLATVILGVSSEFCWRTLLRPRVLWHGAGLAVLTPFGGFNSRWEDVIQISAGRSDVTVIAEGAGGAVLPTRRRPGRIAERSARQLALALRHTRQHSLLGEAPEIPTVHRPVGLYLACAALIPVVVAVLAWAHS